MGGSKGVDKMCENMGGFFFLQIQKSRENVAVNVKLIKNGFQI